MFVEDIAKKALASLVTVVVKDRRGQLIKSGSGFFVGSSHVVTNLHVISGGGSVNVVTLDKKQFSVSSARIDESMISPYWTAPISNGPIHCHSEILTPLRSAKALSLREVLIACRERSARGSSARSAA
jgi:hypothetical protein